MEHYLDATYLRCLHADVVICMSIIIVDPVRFL